MADEPSDSSHADGQGGFNPAKLNRSLISLPLIDEMRQRENNEGAPGIWVIVDINLLFPEGRRIARRKIQDTIARIAGAQALDTLKNECSQQYVFARLTPRQIRDLAASMLEDSDLDRGTEDGPPSRERAIYKIWLDHEVGKLTNKSVSTVKADAARNAFGAFGKDIIWAVLDSGIDGSHPHFKAGTLELRGPLKHRDFTNMADASAGEQSAQRDPLGHGTHVAGIIAGQYVRNQEGGIVARTKRYNEDGKSGEEIDTSIEVMRGMAPEAKLLSLKVLDDNGNGRASNLIAALEYIQDLNANGRHILIHGVNMSVGYNFEPEWFACGQSPLCVEVNRLVRSGVVVVVAAGNTGYGYNETYAKGPRAAGLDITINDPGNAELAITVGSTHRDMPHVYGVSFFSSKGPTGDGRLKPDIVAPGEKIISCQCDEKRRQSEAAPSTPAEAVGKEAYYVEDSGTSMAAPHVSGVIASFLSIRREFVGEPLKIKEIFLNSATDLNRAVYFQGRGLIDLMRAIQSI
jgi:serine protease AprX